MIYRETYPQCADCPYLENIQARRNAHTAKIEKAEADTIDWELRGISEDLETQIAAEEIADFLDTIRDIEKRGELTPEIIAARDNVLTHYARLDKEVSEYGDLVKQRIAWHQNYVATINGMLPDYDTVAELLTEHCEGSSTTHHTIGSVACVSITRPELDGLLPTTS